MGEVEVGLGCGSGWVLGSGCGVGLWVRVLGRVGVGAPGVSVLGFPCRMIPCVLSWDFPLCDSSIFIWLICFGFGLLFRIWTSLDFGLDFCFGY